MRVIQESVPQAQAQTVRVLSLALPAFDGPVHAHPVLELTYIQQGEGLRFVGDTVEPFTAGDLVLVAPQVAHAWWTSRHAEPAAPAAQATVMQLHVAPGLLALPEWAADLATLLAEPAAAWVISGELGARVRPALQSLVAAEGLERLAIGLQLLARIAAPGAAHDRRPLGRRTPGLVGGSTPTQRRVDALLTWVRDHLHEELTVAAASAHLHVTPAAFSRSFRRLVGKSFSDYVNDLRIAEARLRLRGTDRPVTEVAAACGFATLSHFNEQFRRRVGLSPREYRRR